MWGWLSSWGKAVMTAENCSLPWPGAGGLSTLALGLPAPAREGVISWEQEPAEGKGGGGKGGGQGHKVGGVLKVGGQGGPVTQTPASPGPPCSQAPTAASPGGPGGSQEPFLPTLRPRAGPGKDGGMRMVSQSWSLLPPTFYLSSLPRRHTLRSLDGGVSLAGISGHPAAASHLFLCNVLGSHTHHLPRWPHLLPPDCSLSTFSLSQWQLHPLASLAGQKPVCPKDSSLTATPITPKVE